ncbi:unnamed protein product [Paramecium octaurelia]|uniref:Uncharacterized protein n=1 Tax=Paramecium octaurelia TaxID=43137 RepID=A0A8S1SVP8_PAROT|nr:unnamed protein product [Paramecium octaurelia]
MSFFQKQLKSGDQQNNSVYQIIWFKDFTNNEQWKIKQGLVVTIIQISSNCFSNNLVSFCKQVLIQLWVQEKDLKIRNLLKNEKWISMQMQILQKDWQTQQDRIVERMQEMLSRIDELQEQISHEANLNKRDLNLKELDETTEQLYQQIENINCQLILLIVSERLVQSGGENQSNEGITQNHEQRYKIFESVEQIFEIRKWKVLKEAALKNAKSIYIPLITKEREKDEKQDNTLSILINLEQINDTQGELNQFLLEGKETMLLIHGVAGSGQENRRIYLEITQQKYKNQKSNSHTCLYLLTLFKNSCILSVEETLHQDEYNFDQLQLKECKEILQKQEFKLLLLMDKL